MKFKIRTYKPSKDNPEKYIYDKSEKDLEFDTEWFLNTSPSIKDTHLFVPEWEDDQNEDTVILFFLAECAMDLIENNSHLLSQEVLDMLLDFARPNCPTTIRRDEDVDEEEFPF